MDNHPTHLKAKVEVGCPSSGGSGKEWIENIAWEENISYENPLYMNYESQWLPMMFGSPTFVIFNPREANTLSFQESNIGLVVNCLTMFANAKKGSLLSNLQNVVALNNEHPINPLFYQKVMFVQFPCS